MPYIEQRYREQLDPEIKSLIQSIQGCYLTDSGFSQYAGAINYCCTRIAASLMGPVSYWKLALVVGIFVTLIFEFVRRVVNPFEEKKRNGNGDVKEYWEEK